MGPGVTGPAAAALSCELLQRRLMPVSLIRVFQSLFPGTSSTRSGGTTPSHASTSATAIRSMIAADAQTCGAGCTADVIGLFCVPSPKKAEIGLFQTTLDYNFRLCHSLSAAACLTKLLRSEGASASTGKAGSQSRDASKTETKGARWALFRPIATDVPSSWD